MADYAIANQIRPFQLPDIAGIANAMSSQSLNAMREDQLLQQSQQLRGAEAEKGNLRALFSRPDFDPLAPGSAREILLAAPTTGAATFSALMGAQREQRQAQSADLENEAKLFDLSRRGLVGLAALPEGERQTAWTAWRAQTMQRLPYARNIPAAYSPEAYSEMISTADQLAQRYNQELSVFQGPGNVPGLIDRRSGRYQMGTEVPAGGAPAPRAAGPEMTPGQMTAADFLRTREGFREAPYFDRTAHRVGFGSDTTTLADGTVVPVRPGMTISREDAERDLARRVPQFEQRVVAAIGPEAYAAMPPNAQAALISIAYNYGTLPGRIRNAAMSGDPAALAKAVEGLAGDNQGINARRRRDEATMIAGAPTNAMVPGATPVNAMLAPPDAAAVPRPLSPVEFPGAPRPTSLSEADLLKRARDVQQKEAEALMLAEVQRQTAAARIAEEADKARGIAQAQAEVRGNLPAPPPGQRYNAQGVLENIPGSPQALATTERRGAQLTAANVVTRDIDRILERLDNAVMPVTGFTAPTMAALASGSPAADVAELRKTIEGNISFNKLNELRQQSPTGGALGNVTDKDLELLKTTLGSLNQNQSPRQFRQNLLNVRDAFMEVIHGPNFRDVAPPAREPPVPERLPGRRNAPPTGNRPTLEQFLERARPANPNASLEDLTAYYNREYGGR